MQAKANSIQKNDPIMMEVAASALGDPPRKPKINDGAMGPLDKPLDVVHDLNLTSVLLTCLRVPL